MYWMEASRAPKRRRVSLAVGIALVAVGAGLMLFAAAGGGEEPRPCAGRVPIEGFGEIAFKVTRTTGDVDERCALLAATSELRQKGLMGRRDLGGYDAMLFSFEDEITGGFWMKNTIIPLTVAYFDGDGRFVSAQDMEPCPPDGDECPNYPAEGAFKTAIEVPLGGLDDIGIGPGTRINYDAVHPDLEADIR